MVLMCCEWNIKRQYQCNNHFCPDLYTDQCRSKRTYGRWIITKQQRPSYAERYAGSDLQKISSRANKFEAYISRKEVLGVYLNAFPQTINFIEKVKYVILSFVIRKGRRHVVKL
jgi:hypothetical protein